MVGQFYYKKRVLITGGSGFIGKHLQNKLSDYGAIISIIDKNPVYIKSTNVIQSDISKDVNLKSAIRDISPEVVFHLAAYIDRTSEFNIIRKMIEVNLVGTLNLFESLKDSSSCKSIIIAGTSEEYGNNQVPFKENYREDPVSPYSFSKVSISYLSKTLFNVYKFPIVVLRPTLAYGPGQEETMFIPALIKTLLRNERFLITPGEQTRDFIYIDDLVEAYIKAGISEGYFGEIFNIGSGKAYKIKAVANRIASFLNKESLLEVGAKDYRKAEIMSYYADISKAKSCLNWMPQIDIEEGLKRTIESYSNENR